MRALHILFFNIQYFWITQIKPKDKIYTQYIHINIASTLQSMMEEPITDSSIPFDDTSFTFNDTMPNATSLQAPGGTIDWDPLSQSTQAAQCIAQPRRYNTRQRAASISVTLEKQVAQWVDKRNVQRDKVIESSQTAPTEVLAMSSSPPPQQPSSVIIDTPSLPHSQPASTETITIPSSPSQYSCNSTVSEIVNILRAENVALSVSNIKKYAIDKMNLSEDQIQNLIEESLETGAAREVRIHGESCIQLRNHDDEEVVIRDAVENVATNTDDIANQYVEHSEFSKMQSTLQAEINQLKQNQCTTCSSTQSPDNQNHQLLNSLLNQIQFLQGTITTLINNQADQAQIIKCLAQEQPHSNKTTTLPPVPIVIPDDSILQPPPTNKQSQIAAPAPPPLQPNQITNSTTDKPECPTTATTSPHSNSHHRQSADNPGNQHVKKQVLVCGDSLLNGINEQYMRKDHFTQVRNHPGATTEDMLHHIRAHATKKPEAVIVLAGHNDITANERIKEDNRKRPRDQQQDLIKSSDSMKKLIKELKSKLPNAPIAICELPFRNHNPRLMNDEKDINQQFELLAQREQLGYIHMSSYTKEHLGKKGLHPNFKGKAEIANILKSYISKL